MSSPARTASSFSQFGFTFLEVIVALAILGTALTVILGLQSALVERTVVERQQSEALVFAREILSSIEASIAEDPQAIDIGTYSGSPADIMEAILPGDGREVDPIEQTFSANYQVEVNVELVGIPNISNDALKRIELLISWGDRAPENLQFLLFVPYEP